MPDSAGVQISLEDMYRLLVSVDAKVTALSTNANHAAATLTDHETRLRQIEAAEANGARVTAMEEDVKAIRSELEDMKRKVYAIPGASIVIAAAAVVLTLIRTF